jgi:hypothetical protein
MRGGARSVRLAVVAVGAATFVVGTAWATTVVSVTEVSRVSPFANCSVGGGPGTLYVNAEVEPSVSINPANPSNIVAAWQQDRWSNGGSRGLVAGYSFNGGTSWGETPLPFSQCARGLDYERASDPWVSFGPDGTVYTNAIVFNGTNFRNGVAAATSSDGGQTWTNLVKVVEYTTNGSQFSTDKNSITAHPTRPGVAYSVWDTLISPTSKPDDNPHAAVAAAYSGPAYFSKTTNGGRTWSAPQIIVPTAQHRQTIGNMVLVDPRNGGTLYDVFDLIVAPNSFSSTPQAINYNVAFVKSTDDGATWTAPTVISRIMTTYVYDPVTGAAIRTGDIIPAAAIDPTSGALYVVWQDSRFNGKNGHYGSYDEVAFSTSSNGGANWSAPLRVNTPSGKPAFTPSVRANTNGTIAVSYYDFRNLGVSRLPLPTDHWITLSSDGGLTFGSEAHVAGPFDMLSAPNARGYFIGDYVGLDANGSLFRPFFVQTHSVETTTPSSGITDTFAAAVTP